MKKLTLFLFLSMVIVFGAEAHKNRKAGLTISIQTFYDQLSPYGDWIYSPDYGYVWRPYFDSPESFRPYSSNGNWVYTDYGWTWASGYDWGWATFHYGRWDFDNYLGWMWIPGYEWAPAWVSWGSYNNYWGWAPMGPNIYVQSNWYAPDPWWTFVPQNHFCSSTWNRYIYARPVHVTHITHITNVYVDANNHINHNSWYNGPRVTDVEKYSRSKVRRMEVSESQRPERTGIHNNRLDVYRPIVENKRKDYRPEEYRNVEQARTGIRIEQTNARTNDPGVNRTRESRTETRSTNQVPVQHNGNAKSETRLEPRTSTQAPTAKTTEVTRNSRETPRTSTQPDVRKVTTNVEKRVEKRSGSQASTERNSTRPSMEPQREIPNRESNNKITEGNRSTPQPSKIENTEKRQTRTNAPAREKVDNKSSRQSGNREAASTQPSPEKRAQNTATSTAPRTENTDRQQSVKEEVKQSVSKAADESREKRSSGKPTHR
jgi:hypothetical protein